MVKLYFGKIFFLLLCCLLFTPLLSRAQVVDITRLGTATSSATNAAGWTWIESINGISTTKTPLASPVNEIILTAPANNRKGLIYFNPKFAAEPCERWTSEFDFRIFNSTTSTPADGLAFWLLEKLPIASSTLAGQSLGLPDTVKGIVVAIDTYDNNSITCPGRTAPFIELWVGDGLTPYTDCPQGVGYNNASIVQYPARGDNYKHVKVEYANRFISVYVEGVLQMKQPVIPSFSGYFGFSASTGAFNDRHSIKNVHIYYSTPPNIAPIAGVNRAVCQGQSAALGFTRTAGDTYKYKWLEAAATSSGTVPAQGLNSDTLTNPTVQWVAAHAGKTIKYVITKKVFDDPDACVTSDTVRVTFNKVPNKPVVLANGPLVVCAGQSVTLAVTNREAGARLRWFRNNTATGDTSSAITVTLAGKYSVQSTLVTCTAQSDTTILTTLVVPGKPVLTPGTAEVQLCKGDSVTITADGSQGPYFWYRNGVLLPGNSNSIVVDSAGKYTAQLGCSESSDTLAVYQHQLPLAPQIFGPKELCPNRLDSLTYFVIGANMETHITWSIEGGFIINSGDSAAVVFWDNQPGNPHLLKATAISMMGCVSSTGSVAISYLSPASDSCRGPLTIPNVITPNNDGVNDYWAIANLEFEPAQAVTIFNRWGKKVYDNAAYDNTWQAKDLPPGTYFYQVNTGNGGGIYKGFLEVVRQ